MGTERERLENPPPPLFGTDLPDPLELSGEAAENAAHSQRYFSGAAAWIALRNPPDPANGQHQATRRTLLYDRIRQAVFIPYATAKLGLTVAESGAALSTPSQGPPLPGVESHYTGITSLIAAGQRV